MNNIMNLIGKFENRDVPGKLSVRRKYAEAATADYEDLVGERDQAWKDLEETRGTIAFLRNKLDFHPRASKLMVKRKFFIVIAKDEPYFKQAYDLIRYNENLKGTWTPEDERIYQDAVSEDIDFSYDPSADDDHNEDLHLGNDEE